MAEVIPDVEIREMQCSDRSEGQNPPRLTCGSKTGQHPTTGRPAHSALTTRRVGGLHDAKDQRGTPLAGSPDLNPYALGPHDSITMRLREDATLKCDVGICQAARSQPRCVGQECP